MTNTNRKATALTIPKPNTQEIRLSQVQVSADPLPYTAISPFVAGCYFRWIWVDLLLSCLDWRIIPYTIRKHCLSTKPRH
jgi:hypothetical protein